MSCCLGLGVAGGPEDPEPPTHGHTPAAADKPSRAVARGQGFTSRNHRPQLHVDGHPALGLACRRDMCQPCFWAAGAARSSRKEVATSLSPPALPKRSKQRGLPQLGLWQMEFLTYWLQQVRGWLEGSKTQSPPRLFSRMENGL